MQRTATALSPIAEDWMASVLGQVALAGRELDSDASEELAELALAGFRRLQESRVLDLPEGSEERDEALRSARDALQRIMATWLATDPRPQLTTAGLRETLRRLCPIYPFC